MTAFLTRNSKAEALTNLEGLKDSIKGLNDLEYNINIMLLREDKRLGIWYFP
jgi:hypothetical protein